MDDGSLRTLPPLPPPPPPPRKTEYREVRRGAGYRIFSFSDWSTFNVSPAPQVTASLSRSTEEEQAPRGYFTRGDAPSASRRIFPASGDSVITLKQVHVIRCCSRAPVLMLLMMSGRALSCGEVVMSGLELKSIDRRERRSKSEFDGKIWRESSSWTLMTLLEGSTPV